MNAGTVLLIFPDNEVNAIKKGWDKITKGEGKSPGVLAIQKKEPFRKGKKDGNAMQE